MPIAEWLAQLRGLDVRLWLEDDHLHISAAPGVVTPALRAELAARKPEVVAFLHETQRIMRRSSTPLQPVARTGLLPLSFAQQRIWFLDQLQPGSAAYNVPIVIRLIGQLDLSALKQSLSEIIRRHEILRTTFVATAGVPRQVILPPPVGHFPLIELETWPEAGREAAAQRWIAEEIRQPFDLAPGPLLRTSLLRLRETEHLLVLTAHHIIFDGWSWGVFFRELSALYAAYTTGTPAPLPELSIQYADYASWQHDQLRGTALQSQLTYWTNKLSGTLPILQLPIDKPNPSVQTFNGATCTLTLSGDLSEALKTLGQRAGATLFMTLLAAYQVLLYRYTDQPDVLVGTPLAGRTPREVEDLIGIFLNTLVLRADLAGNPRFSDLLKQVRSVALEAFAHADLPFEQLVQALHIEREAGRQPVFQTMFTWQDPAAYPLQLGSLDIRFQPIDTGTTKFDLSLSMEETASGLNAIFEYNTDLFEAATIERLAKCFQTLLESITADPQQPIDDLPLLDHAERQRLLVTWNDTDAETTPAHCVQQLFEAQVERTPEASAVVMTGEALTYRDLNARANQLAHYLQELGVGPETLVGICMERSIEMLIGLLGILKAGGAYVPLDPAYPLERLTWILEDTGASLIVTQERLVDGLPQQAARAICLDADWPVIAQQSTENPHSAVTVDNLAYVIHTSGSTGQPKGVMIQHDSLASYTETVADLFDLGPHDRVLQFASINFDTSAEEIYPCLVRGATLVLRTDEMLASPATFVERCRDWALTVLDLPTSYWHDLTADQSQAPLEFPDSLRLVLVGGERALPDRWAAWQRRVSSRVRLFNGYGPTETTIVATFYEMTKRAEKAGAANTSWREVLIGRPIRNTQVYVLNASRQPVPIGVAGELYIGGRGVARGYLNQPEETAAKFILDPFSPATGTRPRRLYKTGDLVRYLPDGNLEFLGRLDHQVKVRGFRIELGEIETALRQQPVVRDAIVLVREDASGQGRLVAYVIPHQPTPRLADELRSALQRQLPVYMLPAHFVLLSAWPQLPNGKVNRRALLELNIAAPERPDTFVEPREPIEVALANIWRQVLGLERIGLHDNFFELGGDSILSIQVTARANQVGLRLTSRQLFQHQTIAQLAAVVKTAPGLSLEQSPATGEVPLTPIQQWFFEQDLPEPQHWNMPLCLELQRSLERAVLESAVQGVFSQHAAFRLRFVRSPSGWRQFYAESSTPLPLHRLDLAAVPANEQRSQIETAAAWLQASLNLSDGPVVQALLMDFGPAQPQQLLIAAHHLVVDAVSWRLLLEQLQLACEQLERGQTLELPPTLTSFKSWAERLVMYARSAAVQHELDYWLDQAWSQVAPVPIDFPGRSNENTEQSVGAVAVSLSAEATQALLHTTVTAQRAHINEVLLTALVQALAEWTGSNTLCIDLEGHGREEIAPDIDVSRTVGWFTSVFPVLLQLERRSPATALQSIKEQLRHLPSKGLGYGLLRYLNPEADVAERLRALPQAEVSFNYLGQFDRGASLTPLFRVLRPAPGPAHGPNGKRACLLEVDGLVTDGRLQFTWTYSTHVHRRETIERLAQGFVAALRSLASLAEPVHHVPSDFPLARLDWTRLERLLDHYPRLEDVYPLAPGQQEMLRQTRIAPKSGVYCLQWQSLLQGEIEPSLFKQAWEDSVNRHPLLRTAFAWEGLEQPLQIVQRAVVLPWKQYDWRGLAPAEQDRRIEELLRADRERGFDLTQAPLMSFTLIRVKDQAYQFIWSYHHLLLDGWSFTPFLKEVFAMFEVSRQHQRVQLEPPRPYRDYIAWLQRQDLFKAEVYWRGTLRGFQAPTPLPVRRAVTGPLKSTAGYLEHQIRLTAATTTRLQVFAQQQRLTLNTVLQGAWALLLSYYSEQQDIVFGVTVTDRPADLPGVEALIGLFINTLPLRVAVLSEQSLNLWLEKIQHQQAEQQQYGYVSLAQIQAWSEVAPIQPLFTSFLRFQNYPLGVPRWKPDQLGSVQVQTLRDIDWWHYSLGLVVVPGTELVLRIAYNGQLLNADTVAHMLRQLQAVLENFLIDPAQSLGVLLHRLKIAQAEMV